MGFPGPLSLAVGREEGEFYLAHDLFLPLVDVSKKQQMIQSCSSAKGSTGALGCSVKQVGFPSLQVGRGEGEDSDPLTSITRCHYQGRAVLLEAGQCDGTDSDLCSPHALPETAVPHWSRPFLSSRVLPGTQDGEDMHFSLHKKRAV